MIAPRADALGIPRCTREECEEFDFKRCRLLGRRPESVCEIAILVLLRDFNALLEGRPMGPTPAKPEPEQGGAS